jgi:hypothetical protein
MRLSWKGRVSANNMEAEDDSRCSMANSVGTNSTAFPSWEMIRTGVVPAVAVEDEEDS